MITVKQNYDGTIAFEGTQDEVHYLREHVIEILDKFVDLYFNNIGCLDIHTWNDYIDYATASFDRQTELFEGRALTRSERVNFDTIDVGSAYAAYLEATKLMAGEVACYRLQELANEMYSYSSN